MLLGFGEYLEGQEAPADTLLQEADTSQTEAGSSIPVAAVPLWNAGGTFTFAFGQVSLTNWAPGGENSISGNGQANLFLNYNKGRKSWENFLGTAYGLMRQGSDKVRKTNDRLEVYSKYGYRAVNKWFYTAMVKFNTQYSDGFKYPNDSDVISKALAPAYISISAGMDYKPSKKFALYLAPVSGKITIVRDDTLSAHGAFGVKPGEKRRTEFGGFVKINYTDDIMENVNLLTSIDLFSNYLKTPQYIDVSWETTLTMSINKWLTANLSTHLVYDHDVTFPVTDAGGAVIGKESKIQFKEIFGVGLSFRF